MTGLVRLVPAVLIVGLALAATACAQAVAADDEARTVVIDIRNSRFSMAAITTVAGDEIRFVVRNHDPIAHEFILGGDDVHRRHAQGVEREHHGDLPGEVSVPAGQEASTRYRFEQPGQLLFACHLPGHLKFGMSGTVTITD